MNITRIDFGAVYSFLGSVEARDERVKNKAKQMKDYCKALDSNKNKNYHLLSDQRKIHLEQTIGELYNDIQAVLHPVASTRLGADEIYHQNLKDLNTLITVLDKLPPLAFHKELRKLRPELKERIYRLVWLAYKCPEQRDFSQRVLKTDTSILKQELPSLVGDKPGKLLEQAMAGLTYDYQLNQGHPDSHHLVQSKVDFLQDCLSYSTMTYNQLKAIFKNMPSQVKNQLGAMGIEPPFYGKGIHFDAYRKFGAHYNGYSGETTFQVYAPNALKIVLNLTAFGDVQKAIEMKKGSDGVWSVQTFDAKPERTYHYMITGKNGGDPVKKVDPFAFSSLIHDLDGKRENHESVVVDIDKEYSWTDGVWMGKRAGHDFSKQPLTIYEIHAPSWQVNGEGKPLNWRELAHRLHSYCRDNHYNGVELMAMFSHPQPVSMGYQITNFFAPHPEMGSWEDFQYFVDHMHNQNISVFADWVPAHFALDEFALSNFDGTPIFEDDDLEVSYHPKWGTRIFDFKKRFTNDFLASNADFLLRYLHLDGLRVDAVKAMLELNDDRPENYRKRYNKNGDEKNLFAKRFFRQLNRHIHAQFPGVITMAEDASAFPNLVRPVHEKGENVKKRGLGFDFTWHMGFMNDTLDYWQADASRRKELFGVFINTVKAIDGDSDIRPRGKVILPYSHDENAQGKGTILAKMSGETRPEKFAIGLLGLAYQSLRGGGPILDFMGNEFLQSFEWSGILKNWRENPRASVQWEEFDPSSNKFEYQYHRGAQACRRDLNRLFQESPGLWDQTDSGFAWISATDKENCVLSFHRRGGGQQFACIFNTSANDIKNYKIDLPDVSYAPELARLARMKEVYNTDAGQYGGQGRTNAHINVIRNWSNHPVAFELHLPPYTAIVLEEEFF